jgi:hypothetical protein
MYLMPTRGKNCLKWLPESQKKIKARLIKPGEAREE